MVEIDYDSEMVGTIDVPERDRLPQVRKHAAHAAIVSPLTHQREVACAGPIGEG